VTSRQAGHSVVFASTYGDGSGSASWNLLGNRVQRPGHRVVPHPYTRSNAIRYTERLTCPSPRGLGRVVPHTHRARPADDTLWRGAGLVPAFTLGGECNAQRADHRIAAAFCSAPSLFQDRESCTQPGNSRHCKSLRNPAREPFAELRRASHHELQGNPAPSSRAYSMFATSTKHPGEM
jgi:hypothetical protein